MPFISTMGSLHDRLHDHHPPKASQLERTHILKDILDNIDKFAKKHPLIHFDVLKNEVLKPVLNENFDPEVQLRGFLKAFKDTNTFNSAFNDISDPKLKEQIQRFIQGESPKNAVGEHGFEVTGHPSPPVQHHFSLLEQVKKLVTDVSELKTAIHDVFHPHHADVKNLPVIWEDKDEKDLMKVYSDVKFQNWGETVTNTPRYTYVPTKVLGIQNVVRYAKQNNLRVRCGGYRHSWSNIFSQNNEILISLLDLHQVTTLPDPMSLNPLPFNPDGPNELKRIELKEDLPNNKRLCRVGVAVTNEDFRKWAVKNDAWTLPVDVILVEVTIGGVNGPICHGAGHAHKTISDYVRRVEYVDCNGDVQIVDDPYLIKAAAGAFGLLGVVTHITFELDAMSYAVLKPQKVDVGLAIPPINKEDIPKALRGDWYNSPDAATQLENAKKEFDHRALNDYYAEWFWFTYQKRAWVNTWNPVTNPDPSKVVDYPNEVQTFLQWVEGWIGGVITSTFFFQEIPGYWQAQLLATSGMAALPPTLGEDQNPTFITALPNALHFRRGVQNMRVRDMEFQIPLRARKDDPTKPDFSLAQRAWWDIINLVYQDADKPDPSSPMRLTLEMRIMGGSDVLMAPQRGNEFGTVSIEVLSIPDAVKDAEWHDFLQRVADIWMSYGDDLNVRPHWAKEWEGLNFKGQEAGKYLKTVAYPKQIAEFKGALQKIGEPHGWGLDQLKGRFSNELLDKLIFA